MTRRGRDTDYVDFFFYYEQSLETPSVHHYQN